MDETLPTPEQPAATPVKLTRRNLMLYIGIALNGAVALAIATPVIGYLLGPVTKRRQYLAWVDLGEASSFTPGETKLVNFRTPFTDPWDGDTANLPAYVRCSPAGEYTVFAINCAHLGCPVRWFSESQLFLCPCHGGVYYADGSRASGPPERGLFTYPIKIVNGHLLIDAGQMPTLSNQASLKPCPASNQPNHIVARIAPCPGTNESTIG